MANQSHPLDGDVTRQTLSRRFLVFSYFARQISAFITAARLSFSSNCIFDDPIVELILRVVYPRFAGYTVAV
ncbi:hypothetical protein, partial [Pectobacterium versatile]|uniref:hypothetical protein n=1 Tax=Pectobacterium versatile TaxID=2488639 RepID=UPI001CD149CF